MEQMEIVHSQQFVSEYSLSYHGGGGIGRMCRLPPTPTPPPHIRLD